MTWFDAKTKGWIHVANSRMSLRTMKHSTHMNNCMGTKEPEYNGPIDNANMSMSRLEQQEIPLTMKKETPYPDARNTEPRNIAAVSSNRNAKEYESTKDDDNMQNSSSVPTGPRQRLYFLNQATSKHNSDQRNEKFSHEPMNQGDNDDNEYYYYAD